MWLIPTAGKDGHNLKRCPKPLVNGGLGFAVCFICKGTGHVSSKCPQNTHGIYPKGGCCKVCGDVWHLAKDCPDKGTAKDRKASAEAKGIKGPGQKVDLDIVGNVEYEYNGKGQGRPGAAKEEEEAQPEKKKKTKVVKF